MIPNALWVKHTL